MRKSAASAQTASIADMEMYYQTHGEGEPLLLLHGFTGSGADWRLVFNEAPADQSLVIPDLRGHGRSTNPSSVFTFRQAALDVFSLLDWTAIRLVTRILYSFHRTTQSRMAVPPRRARQSQQRQPAKGSGYQRQALGWLAEAIRTELALDESPRRA